jgi:Ner family transcriptional regulator
MEKLNNPKKASPEDWHPADIVAALRKKGWSLRRLSMHYQLSPDTLKAAIQVPYPNGEKLIAAAIGVKPWEIWPSRYDAGGNPNRGRKLRGFKQFNASVEMCNVKVNGGE